MKRLLIILPLVLCVIISCQDKATKAELEQFKTQQELEEQNKEMLRQYYTELDNIDINDLDKFINKFISKDFVIHFPGGIDINGKEGLLAYYTNSMNAFNGIHAIEDIIAEENKIAFRAIATLNQKEEYMGIQPKDNEIKVTFDGFWSVKDGKVVEWWSEYDALGMMQQLGMELKMK
jgi:predicted ester cyclase